CGTDEGRPGRGQGQRDTTGAPQGGLGQIQARWQGGGNHTAPAKKGLQSLPGPDCRGLSHDPRALHSHGEASACQTPGRVRPLRPHWPTCGGSMKLYVLLCGWPRGRRMTRCSSKKSLSNSYLSSSQSLLQKPTGTMPQSLSCWSIN